MMFASLALALFPLAQEPAPEAAPQDPASPVQERIQDDTSQLQVVYLANAGFLLRTGNFSIVIDGFMKDSFEGHEALPKNAARKLQSGEKPFNGFVFGLVSHMRPDHFQPRVVERFLRNNPQAAMMSGPQVINRLVQGAKDFKSIQKQARAIGTKPGELKMLNLGRTRVEFMQLPHNQEAGNVEMQNYGHLIHVAGLRVLHVGDAAPDLKTFQDLGLAQKDIDVAFVPYWFFSVESGLQILDEVLKADYVITYGIPAAEKALFVERMKIANPHVISFDKTFDSMIIDNGPAPTPATGSDG